MALATSTERERAEKFLGPHGLLPYFDKMIFGNSIPADRGKPNPDIYLKACEMLGVELDDAHDADADVTATKEVLRLLTVRSRNEDAENDGSTVITKKEKTRAHFKI